MTERAPVGRRPDTRRVSLGKRLELGRRLRILAGADEGILDQVPLERTRHVGLGGVVLGTAVVAAVSMWFALSQVLGAPHIGLLIPTVIWLLIVLNLDRWLVSTVTSIWQQRVMLLVPRLLVAGVLGIIIAEPLVLRVFETAVVQHVVDGRQAALNSERDLLLACNPQTPGEAPKSRECGNARLLAYGAEADVARLSELEDDAERLRKQIRADKARSAWLFDRATDECVGRKTGVTSGQRGDGQFCKRFTREAKAWSSRSGLPGNQRTLRSLEDRISALRGPLADKQADFGQRVEDRIQERLASLPGRDDPVGLLERMRALHEITAENPYLFGASWLFRIFLVLIDCLPVLVKLMGGTTAYDRMVDQATRTREKVHEKRLQLDADARIGELELQGYREAEERRRQRQLIEIAGKGADAEARATVEKMVRQRTEELRRQSDGEERINGSHPRGDLLAKRFR
ncbi:DUF4407 domain-containing protein [Streptosporangium sp. NPDC006007]|uniref:DUF4407 domain-containing protein n=1 Tax=Streptosporangium sp. NPDC006007 TaxID=3154575 RepID=UPI0033AEE965